MEKCLPLLPRETFHKVLVWHFQPPPQNTLSFNGRYVARCCWFRHTNHCRLSVASPVLSSSGICRWSHMKVQYIRGRMQYLCPIHRNSSWMAPSKAHAPLLQQTNGERSGGGGERDRTYIGTSVPTTASSAHPLFVTISVPPCMHPSTTTKYDPPAASSPSK